MRADKKTLDKTLAFIARVEGKRQAPVVRQLGALGNSVAGVNLWRPVGVP